MSEKKKESPLPPIVRQLGWVSLFTDASSELIYPLLPAFLATMGAAGTWLGIVEGVAESVGSFVKWVAGALSDRRVHRKPYVLAGYGLSTVVRPLVALVAAPWQVVLVRSTDRVGKGVRAGPRDAILAGAVDAGSRARAYGVQRMMDNTGSVIGPTVAFALAQGLGWSLREIFAFAIFPGLIAMAVLAFGVHEPDAPVDAAPAAKPADDAHAGDPRKVPLAPPVRRYLLAVAFFSLGASADTFILLRLHKLGLPNAWLPVAWLTLSAARALMNVPGGRLSDRVGHRKTVRVAWFLYAGVYVIFPLVHTVAATWAVMLIYGGYYGLSEGGGRAILAELAPAEQRGRAFGALHAVTGFAVLPANALFGVLFDAHPAAAFWMSATFAATGALLLGRKVSAGRAA